MPGRLTDEVFSILEKTFGEVPFAAKAVENTGKRGEDVEINRPVTGTFFDDAATSDDETPSEASTGMHEGYENPTPPMSLTRQSSGLPPTPPTQSQDSPDNSPLSPAPLFANGTRNSLRAQKSGFSTPVNQRSPPTPEITPPSTRDSLAPPRPFLEHHASSRAESFTTALESQSRQASQLHLPIGDEVAQSWLYATKEKRLNTIGLGVSGVEMQNVEEADDVTPTAERRDPLQEQVRQNLAYSDGSGEALEDVIPRREMDTNFLRNVTVRKRRPKKPQVDTSVPRESPTREEVTSVERPKRNASLRERLERSHQSPHSASTEKFAEDIDWPSAANDMLYTHLRDEKAKRLSSMSGTSTVVEAIVLSTPPRRQGTLRRAGKNLALRDDVSVPSRSARTSVDSEDILQHRLRHRRSPLPNRKSRLSTDTDEVPSLRTVSSPETVIRQKSISRSPPATVTDILENEHKTGRELSPRRLDDRLPLQAGGQKLHALPNGERKQLRHVSAPLYLDRNTHARKASEAASVNSGDTQRTPLLTTPMLANAPRPGWYRESSEDTDLLSPVSEYRSEAPRSVDESASQRPHASHSSTGSPTLARIDLAAPRSSFDRLVPSSPRRKSVDPRRDSSTGRVGHLNSTPMSLSQFSDRTDTLEVNEATAVSIYPHNNKSLLVVQQVARPDVLLRRQMITMENATAITEKSDEDDMTPVQPIFTAFINPSTPPLKTTNPMQVDSPLKNPRAAPEPPIIQFIPPTPADEMDRQLALIESGSTLSPDEASKRHTITDRPEHPIRRPSLLQKARRYSESFASGLLGRTSSTRTRRPGRIPGVGERDTNLHPFWRPRGFWDDFESDSEDEADEPLPRGGDTSDVEDEEKSSKLAWPRKMSVRMPGFTGSGGFLLGNSLGVERHGTNSRRHFVSLPNALALAGRRGSGSPAAQGVRVAKNKGSLRKRTSEEMLRGFVGSTESLRHRGAFGGKRRKLHRIPGLGVRVEYVGFKGLREKMRMHREDKEEMKREKLREEIRKKIGSKVYHGDGVERRLD